MRAELRRRELVARGSRGGGAPTDQAAAAGGGRGAMACGGRFVRRAARSSGGGGLVETASVLLSSGSLTPLFHYLGTVAQTPHPHVAKLASHLLCRPYIHPRPWFTRK